MPDERKYEVFLGMQQHNGVVFTNIELVCDWRRVVVVVVVVAGPIVQNLTYC
jgi:hypothetical protein